jgi:tRNA U38,U39,U40 pseudouridine synthase TruA
MENIFWTGFSYEERHSAISKIQNVVSKYGYIIDFHQFSDISISVVIEVNEFKIDKLHADLKKIIGLKDFESLYSTSAKERMVYLNITFPKGTGNHKIEVPAVPG